MAHTPKNFTLKASNNIINFLVGDTAAVCECMWPMGTECSSRGHTYMNRDWLNMLTITQSHTLA